VSDTLRNKFEEMGRAPRIDIAGTIYHVFSRASAKAVIFRESADFIAFENILHTAYEQFGPEIFAYQIMPNHWHFCLRTLRDGDLSRFMQWLKLTHTQRHHVYRDIVGTGPLYQGRYKSIIVSDNNYFISLCRYIETNALRAGLVRRAEDWRWSSLWRRLHGSKQQQDILAQWPVARPEDYVLWVNLPLTSNDIDLFGKML